MDGVTRGHGGRADSPEGAGVELAESVFSPPLSFLLGRYGHFHQRHPSTGRHRLVCWVRGQQHSSTKRPSPPPHAARQHKLSRKTCTREGRIALFTGPRAVISPYASPPSLKPRRFRPAAASALIARGIIFERLTRNLQTSNSSGPRLKYRDRDFNRRVGRRRDVEGGRLPASHAGPLAKQRPLLISRGRQWQW